MFSRYIGIVNSRVRETYVYRFDYVVRILTSFMSLFISWFIWKAIFESGGAVIGGFTFPQMVTYFTLSAISSVIFMSFAEFEMESEVKNGAIATYLIKPISYPLLVFFRMLGSKIGGFFAQIIPLLLTAIFVLNISSPVSWMFLISLVLSYMINFAIVFMTGMTVFWMKGDIWGIRLSRYVVFGIMSGSVIPLTFFPNWFASLSAVLPFAMVFYIPVSIYMGKIAGTEIFSSLALQLFWTVVLVLLTYFIWKKAEKKIFVQGG